MHAAWVEYGRVQSSRIDTNPVVMPPRDRPCGTACPEAHEEFSELAGIAPEADLGASRARVGDALPKGEPAAGLLGGVRRAAGGLRARATSATDDVWREGGLPIDETKATARLRDCSVASRDSMGGDSSLRASSRE